MSMIADAMKFLADLQKQAVDPVEIEGIDARVKYFVINGERQAFTTEPKPRDHRVLTLQDLIRHAARFDSGDGCVAWINPDRVTLVLNDDDYRDQRVEFLLKESIPWLRLRTWNVSPGVKSQVHSQADFIRILRVDFFGAHDPAELLNRVRRMTWTSVTTSERHSAKESMGRAIEAVAGTGAESIPEEITLVVPVYENPGERATYPIRCAVEVLPEERQFRLTPMPGEIARVQDLALASIMQRLTDLLPKTTPAYFGAP